MKKVHLSLLGIFSLGLIAFIINTTSAPKSVERNPPKPPKKNSQAPNDWFLKQRSYPNANMNYEVYERELGKFQQKAKSLNKRQGGARWESIGPHNIEGRIVSLSYTQSGMLYAGTASGGVFRTPNNYHWESIFDNAGSLSIGDVGIAPSDENIIYVGTGEANGGGGSMNYPGNGIHKSVDGGQTWVRAGLANTRFIGKISVHPTDPNTLFVAAMGHLFSHSEDRGLFRSTDGGVTWERVHYISERTGFIDVIIDPANPNRVYAASWERIRNENDLSYSGTESAVYRSDDGGDTWTQLQSGLPEAGAVYGRIGLSVSTNHSNVVYAAYSDQDANFLGVYRSDDSGDSWRDVSASLKENYENIYSDGAGSWFSVISVDPNNPERVFLCGLNLFFSTNGGETWIEYNQYQDNLDPDNNLPWYLRVHVDHHAVAFHPTNEHMIANGNDGGVYIAESEQLLLRTPENMPITQFYTCKIDPSDPNRVFGGTQDNGTNYFDQNFSYPDWIFASGGDGFQVAIDPRDGYHYFSESQFGYIYEIWDSYFEFDWQLITGDLLDERFNWNTPLMLDPSDPDLLYFASHRLYKRTSEAITPISPDLTKNLATGEEDYPWSTITSFDVAKANSQVIYVGTDDGNLWVTKDSGTNWEAINENLPNRWVTRVTIDPNAENVAYVTYSGFRYEDYLPHVFKTEDYGTTWTDISGNLPELPVNDILVDPNNSDILMLANDVSVFVSTTGGTQWQLMAPGLPLSVVNDLDFHNGSRKLVAATYGRSMYTINLDDALARLEVPTTFAHSQILSNVHADDSRDTLIGIINPQESANNVAILAFDSEGSLLGQVSHQLNGFTQVTDQVSTLLGSLGPEIAWLKIESEEPVHVYADQNDGKSSAAYWASDELETSLTAPHVAKRTDIFETNLVVVNGTNTGFDTQFISEQSQETVLEHYLPYSQLNRDVRQIFDQNLDQVPYVEVKTETASLAGMEYFVSLPNRDQEAALDLNSDKGKTIHYLHIANRTDQFWTGLVYLNASDTAAQVTEYYYTNHGTLLETRTETDFQAGQKKTILIDHETDNFPTNASWVTIEADQDLIGYQLFGAARTTENHFMAGFQGSYTQDSTLVFPHVNKRENGWTAYALVNMGETPSNILLTLYDISGNVLAHNSIDEISANAKMAFTLEAQFPDTDLTNASWLKAESSDATWAGFQIWGNDDQQYMSGLKAN